MRLLLTGAGSSRHAAEIAAPWFRWGRFDADAYPATDLVDHGSEFLSARTRGNTPDSCAALITITQSGATGSVLRLLDAAGAEDVFRIVITNEAQSEAVKRADLAVVTRAGPEHAIPATKSFSSALAALWVLALDWKRAYNALLLDDPVFRSLLDDSALRDSRLTVRALETGLRCAAPIAEFANRSVEGPWFFLGHGSLRPLAAEGALKMVETAAVPALALPSGELTHGPRVLLSANTPVIALSDLVNLSDSENRSLLAAREAGAPVLRLFAHAVEVESEVITEWGPGLMRPDSDSQVSMERERDFLWLGAGAEIRIAPFQMPFQMPPMLQLLALYAGVRRGRKVDEPEGLRKAVTDD